MANLTPEPDTQDLLKRNVLGPAIFVLGAFIAVMMALDLYIGAGTGLVGDLARSIRDAIGLLPAFLAGAGTAWAGARLFLQDEPDDTLHHLAGWILVSLALSLVLAPISSTAGGALGNGITGRWKVGGFFLGLAALFAPVWFFWLRDRFVLPDESEMPESLSQTLVDEGAAGISAEEADALLPADDDSYQPARQNPELAELLAKSLAGTAVNQAIETKALSPYPDDVRKSGGIPAGTVPIEVPRDADGNVAFAAGIEPTDEDVSTEAAPKPSKEESSGSDSVHRWAPKERRLAGQTLGEDAPQEAGTPEKAPRKLQVNHPAAAEVTPIPQDARPIEDMVDIPPRPIWEAEEAGDDTAGAIADALFGDGPIGPVRTLPHDAPGAAETLAADAERVPEFSLEAPELEDVEVEEELAEWEDDEEELEEDGEYAEADELEEDELEDDEEYEDEEYEEDAAAELEEEDEEELEDDEEYEDDEAAELEEDELEDDEEDEGEEDAEAAELEEDEEEEYEEEAAELEEDEPEEGEEYEDEEEAAELEEEELEEDEEYEEVAELEDEEPEEEAAHAESEVVLTPKAPPTPEPAAAKAKAVDAGGRVSPEIVYDAGVLFLERGRVAVSLLQREFGLDFDESCEVMDRLQKLGLIGPYVGGHRRDILLSREEWLEKATVG